MRHIVISLLLSAAVAGSVRAAGRKAVVMQTIAEDILVLLTH